MSQQKQAPLPRQEFQEWLENAAVPVLVLQKGKHLGSVVKVPATPEIDYLFGYKFMPRMELAGLVTLMVAAGVWGMRRVMAVGTPETKGCV